jgi:hypothetical protein
MVAETKKRMSRNRPLAHDFERPAKIISAFIRLAMSRIMTASLGQANQLRQTVF